MSVFPKRVSIAGTVIATGIGVSVALAVGTGGQMTAGVPVAVWCAAWAFGLNWVMFIFSWLGRTEKFFDLTGTITYLTTMILAAWLSSDLDVRAWLAVVLVGAWTVRLGTFLFTRILADGKDGRFDKIKTDFWRLLMTWTLQGLWVVFTSAAAVAIVASAVRVAFDVWAGVGVALWVVGFVIEVVADDQKRRFKADPANEGRFITTGLWAWSRHPNYFGEITLWAGIAVLAVPVLSGWQWVAMVSPVFVFVLLTRVSGIPMLERRATKRWGHEDEFQQYVANVPVLVPRPPR